MVNENNGGKKSVNKTKINVQVHTVELDNCLRV